MARPVRTNETDDNEAQRPERNLHGSDDGVVGQDLDEQDVYRMADGVGEEAIDWDARDDDDEAFGIDAVEYDDD